VFAMETRLARVKAGLGPPAGEITDRAPWDWYAESCPCPGAPGPGACREHPRARTSQRPPAGDWRVWGYVAGRGAGKTRAGACWVQQRVQAGTMNLGCLIAPTASDIRDVMVEGPSGLLAVAPPWCLPRFEPSKRRVSWPNGARAICLSGEEPERCRGLNVDTLWADELACWQRAESTWDLAMLALRAGSNPQALITTTPRRVAVLRRILAEASTVQTTDTTFANEAHLPPQFVAQIVALYQNTKLGRQEIYAEFLDTTDGVWFARFDPSRHVSFLAEYSAIYHVRCAIDAGTSRHTAAVFFQVRHHNGLAPPQVTVFGEYHALDVVSRKNAFAIRELARTLPCLGKLDRVRLDPAATARSSLGPAAYSEYEQVFGPRLVARWPRHLVLDGLEMMDLLLESGNLLIHPRCRRLKEAFQTYSRQRRGGEWINYPADSHPEEDFIDALRGGIRDAFPDGLVPRPNLRPVHAGRVMG
jgi:Terminase large subunit, T4likevirus-type, N-terminal